MKIGSSDMAAFLIGAVIVGCIAFIVYMLSTMPRIIPPTNQQRMAVALERIADSLEKEIKP